MKLARSTVSLMTLLAACACVYATGCATPPRDQIMRMERAHGLALDAIEVAVAAGQLDDKQRRDVVRAAENQMNAAIAAANKLRNTPGSSLVDDSEPVARFDAAAARLAAALQAGQTQAERDAAAEERRRNEFLNELLGARSVATTKAGTP